MLNRSLNESLRLLLLRIAQLLLWDHLLWALKNLLVAIILTQIVIHLGKGVLNGLLPIFDVKIKLLVSKLLRVVIFTLKVLWIVKARFNTVVVVVHFVFFGSHLSRRISCCLPW